MIKRIRQIMLVFVAVILSLAPSALLATKTYATPTFTEYLVTSANAHPQYIAAGSDGALWFTEEFKNQIGRITTQGIVTEFPVPTQSSFPYGITAGPDGALWFTELSSQKIGRITTSGQITEYNLTTNNMSPFGITAGPDGALWFVQDSSTISYVSRITTSGIITNFSVPTPGADPIGITAGPDGALWFTEQQTGTIGRITTSGSIQEFHLTSSNAGFSNITAGPDGALWFTETFANRIGRLTTAGAFTEYQLPPDSNMSSASPGGITSGSDSSLWFTQGNGRIGSISLTGSVSSYSIPTPSSTPVGITQAQDGTLWFTEASGNKIGNLTVNLVPSSPSNVMAASPTQQPVIAWDAISNATSYNIYRNGTNVGSAASTTFTDTTAPEGMDTYYVTAVNSSGESAPSNNVDVVVDRTAPNVIGTPDSSPNSNGWYNHDVTINWASADPSPSSGAPTQPAPTTATLEGSHTYTSDQSCDPATNCSTGSLDLNIDKTVPTIDYTVAPAANTNGWNNTDVTVTFTCNDAISGIDTCPSPMTVSTEGASQTVAGTATDLAGNSTTITANVNIDKTAPIITSSLSQAPNANGWFNSPVTANYMCSDATSGIALCASPQTESTDGMYTLSGTAVDNAGNTSDIQTQVNVDTTAPAVSNLTWTANPVSQGSNTTLSVSASDNLSGVASAYYTVDGGAPQAMAYDTTSGTWRATFGASLASNTYTVNVYAIDYAGNTSASATDVLTVSSSSVVSGHAKLVPTASDTLPIAIDTAIHNPTEFSLGFSSNNNGPNSVEAHYVIKNNKDEFDFNSTAIDWVVIPDSTHASIMVHGNMTTYVNGAVTVTQNAAMRVDVTLGTGGVTDLITVKIWNPGQNTNTTPAYQVSEYDIANKSQVNIQ